jgi:hypothetical protein
MNGLKDGTVAPWSEILAEMLGFHGIDGGRYSAMPAVRIVPDGLSRPYRSGTIRAGTLPKWQQEGDHPLLVWGV